MHYTSAKAILGIIIGFALIFAPSIRRKKEAEREARLTELADGAPEQYFEERRQLEAYPVGPILRVLGGLLVISGTAVLLLSLAP